MFLMILTILFYGIVVLCASVVPLRSQFSSYERSRREKLGDAAVDIEAKRSQTADDVAGLLRVIGALALVISILLSIGSFGWVYGTIIAVIGVLCYGLIARLAMVHTVCQGLYDHLEVWLIDVMVRNAAIFKFFRTVPSESTTTAIASREELIFTIESLSNITTKDERRLLLSGLTFGDKTIESVMTPRSVLDVVHTHDVVGPLMLDELHRTGHSRFPVIDGDVDHVVGVLHIQNLLRLQDKKTHKAQDLMTTPVYYIKESQSLQTALAAFLRTHHHLFVVVNEYRETTGVLTLEDVIEVLIGRKIIDEFDMHDDLRAVAARNPRGNNTATKHTDVA